MKRPEFIESLEAAAKNAGDAPISYSSSAGPANILELIRYVKVLEKTLDNQFSPNLRDELIDEANGELYPEAQP